MSATSNNNHIKHTTVTYTGFLFWLREGSGVKYDQSFETTTLLRLKRFSK